MDTKDFTAGFTVKSAVSLSFCCLADRPMRSPKLHRSAFFDCIGRYLWTKACVALPGGGIPLAATSASSVLSISVHSLASLGAVGPSLCPLSQNGFHATTQHIYDV